MRVLLKISWEALQWEREHGIDPHFIHELAEQIKEIQDDWHEIGIVLWWGNIFRWVAWAANGLDRSAADYMGMLATVMNWVAMQDAIEDVWIPTRLMSAIDIPEVWEKYIKRRAERHLEKWRIIISVAWTWNPFFTTDSAWVLRWLELGCDMMIKATKVDWVYDKDPKKYNDAKLIKHASYSDIIAKDVKVMDHTAITLAKEWKLTLKVVNLYKQWAILRAINWEEEGTIID